MINKIPEIPDFDISGIPRHAHELGLLSSDFYDYSYNPTNLEKCSIVDDSTGIITRYKYLKLEPCPLQLGTSTSYYKTDSSGNIVTSDSFQFNYNLNDSDNPQP